MLPFILRWEGGFVNDPTDRGGCNKQGVTITWRQVGYDKDGDGDIDVDDLKLLTNEDVRDRVLVPIIGTVGKRTLLTTKKSQIFLVDWVWSWDHGIKIPQRVFLVNVDGITLALRLSSGKPDQILCFWQYMTNV